MPLTTGPTAGPTDTEPLALALSGLIDRGPPRSDRRTLTLVALALMVGDAAAISALHRRGRDVRMVNSR